MLIVFIGLRDLKDLIISHAAWVDEAFQQEKKARDCKWTETIAVGRSGYVDSIKEQLGALFLSRRVQGKDSQYELHEAQGFYDYSSKHLSVGSRWDPLPCVLFLRSPFLGSKKRGLRAKMRASFWEVQ